MEKRNKGERGTDYRFPTILPRKMMNHFEHIDRFPGLFSRVGVVCAVFEGFCQQRNDGVIDHLRIEVAVRAEWWLVVFVHFCIDSHGCGPGMRVIMYRLEPCELCDRRTRLPCQLIATFRSPSIRSGDWRGYSR